MVTSDFLALSAYDAEQGLCICRASVRSSVRMSVPAWATAADFAALALPGTRHSSAACGGQMRAVSLCQRTYEYKQRRLVIFCAIQNTYLLTCGDAG